MMPLKSDEEDARAIRKAVIVIAMIAIAYGLVAGAAGFMIGRW